MGDEQELSYPVSNCHELSGVAPNCAQATLRMNADLLDRQGAALSSVTGPSSSVSVGLYSTTLVLRYTSAQEEQQPACSVTVRRPNEEDASSCLLVDSGAQWPRIGDATSGSRISVSTDPVR